MLNVIVTIFIAQVVHINSNPNTLSKVCSQYTQVLYQYGFYVCVIWKDLVNKHSFIAIVFA